MHVSRMSFLLLLALAAVPGRPADDAGLHLTLRNLTPGEGQLLIGVCLEREFLKSGCTFQTIVPVTADPQTVTVPAAALPPARYAVQVIYDRNGNRELDSNFIGIPREPVGFSRNATGRFGPPKFEHAAFRYDGTAQQLTIDLF